MRKRVATIALAAAVLSCADGPVEPRRNAESETPPVSESNPLSPAREITLSLVGRGWTIESRVETTSGEQRILSTTLEAATRAIVVGQPVDTLLAIAFPGAPAAGDLMLTPPTTVTIKDVAPGIPIIFFEGSPGRLELLVFTRASGFPLRQLVQAEPATLTVTELVAPEPLRDNGRLEGRIDFLAEEYVREWSPDGAISIRKNAGRVRVTANIEVQLEHRIRQVQAPPLP